MKNEISTGALITIIIMAAIAALLMVKCDVDGAEIMAVSGQQAVTEIEVSAEQMSGITSYKIISEGRDLSQLDFPMNILLVKLKGGISTEKWQVNIDYSKNATSKAGYMFDTDWDESGAVWLYAKCDSEMDYQEISAELLYKYQVAQGKIGLKVEKQDMYWTHGGYLDQWVYQDGPHTLDPGDDPYLTYKVEELNILLVNKNEWNLTDKASISLALTPGVALYDHKDDHIATDIKRAVSIVGLKIAAELKAKYKLSDSVVIGIVYSASSVIGQGIETVEMNGQTNEGGKNEIESNSQKTGVWFSYSF